MKKGFTLIELMIVIVLIAILSTVFINTSIINLKRARDTRRKSDLELIRSGIETYRADCNTYPTQDIFSNTNLVGNGNTSYCPTTNIYISKIPTDPSPGQNYVYTTTGGGATYQICANLEAPLAGNPTSYCVVNP